MDTFQSNPKESARKKVILDVDTGIDDALAVIYALRSPKLEVLGITTCFGNVDVDTAAANTLLIAELLESEVPVFRGSAAPVARKWNGPKTWIHGNNGLGNALLPKLTRKPESKDAVTFIQETIRSYPGEVAIIPVAPLTNLARAFVEQPDLAELTREVVLMGGAAFCPGNVTPVAEANMWSDPEAAKLVFQSGVKLSMVGLDVTMKVPLYWEDVERLPNDTLGSLLRDALQFYIGAYQKEGVEHGLWCAVHDPMAVAMAEDASMFETAPYFVDVETDGRLTTGMTVVDARKRPRNEANANICLGVDKARFLEELGIRLNLS